MKIKTCCFLLLAVALAGGCAKPDKYEAFAKDFCACAQPLVDLDKEIKAASDAQKEQELAALMEKGMKVDEESQKCLTELEKKHGSMEALEDQKKAMAAMEKICPDITKMMQGGGQEEMPEDAMPPVEPDTTEAQ